MPESQVSYRYAHMGDNEAIANLGARVFTSAFAPLLPLNDLTTYLSEAYSPKSIATDLRDPSVTFVVAMKDESLVGFLQLRRGTSERCIDKMENKIQLQRLYVSESCQGLGIGKRLLARAEKEARGMGGKNIWLASWKPNLKAERLYESTGYLKAGEMAFTLGNSRLEDWVMIKSI
ncbi:acyl-CoA N-acyltransferase [Penicillium samsonianum]|uniref:acyl-CoA N-acyltransferase n=1 Tax=Penicillium samsonianum TaxID=1882272 RepID=UPI002548013A|nr:acyl-CoA N-acyltransferase [Penicillium samsonianum]KAJ6118282.1 acyl-CoA N-acyltransferase [Penicillium samsonianum]